MAQTGVSRLNALKGILTGSTGLTLERREELLLSLTRVSLLPDDEGTQTVATPHALSARVTLDTGLTLNAGSTPSASGASSTIGTVGASSTDRTMLGTERERLLDLLVEVLRVKRQIAHVL